MKKLVTIAILGAMGFAGAAGAEANDGHGRGPERRHERPSATRNHRPERTHRVWVPARYECRVVGYECGRPITREVLVQPGYWSIQAVCD
jgi:hypothetical protein